MLDIEMSQAGFSKEMRTLCLISLPNTLITNSSTNDHNVDNNNSFSHWTLRWFLRPRIVFGSSTPHCVQHKQMQQNQAH